MAKRLKYSSIISFLLIFFTVQFAFSSAAIEHQQRQQRPIELGTSGSNLNDISFLYCCGGTLGGLVEDGEKQYILSNNHVLALTNTGQTGDKIVQPGLIDNFCIQDAGDTVAYLSDFVKIRFKKGRSIPINKVDAAIAEVVPAAVDANGSILGIGGLSIDIVEAFAGQSVKKSGRTTGLTYGVVMDVDVTVDVSYSKSCGGPSNQLARFSGQILIGPGGFSGGGDSGSLIVEDVNDQPSAVGLLFAGSELVTVANPIGLVLESFGVSMPGGASPPEPEPEPGTTGTIAGRVTDITGKSSIEGAVVQVDTGQQAITGADGSYAIIEVSTGGHSVTASADGYKSSTKYATVYENQVTMVDFKLKAQKARAQNNAAFEKARKVKKQHQDKLFKIKSVVGCGVGLSKKGQPVIHVYLEKESKDARGQIPSDLDNVPVEIIVTGPIEAF